MFGHNVSHANNKTNRTFYPNVRWVRVYSQKLNQCVSLKLSAAGVKTLEKNGGLDAYVTKKNDSKLSTALLKVKKQIQKIPGHPKNPQD